MAAIFKPPSSVLKSNKVLTGAAVGAWLEIVLPTHHRSSTSCVKCEGLEIYGLMYCKLGNKPCKTRKCDLHRLEMLDERFGEAQIAAEDSCDDAAVASSVAVVGEQQRVAPVGLRSTYSV